ncbi:MAG: DNA repair protein RecN [Betaproteobacteria bacterium]|nr:DNA repair protein RecN [Betaproteobacteria bacterium]
MLRVLSVRDYVIAERVELEPGPGYTVLTGETGAGKSILVDALELLVGGRADSALVREGAERAELTAEFDVAPRSALAAWLAELELQGDPGSLILRRTLERGGRSRCFINGHVATLAQLREAGEHLVDIHGQHEHQSLLRPAAQRELLDAHGGGEALARDCAVAYRDWQRLRALAADAEKQFAQHEAERAELEEKRGLLDKLAPQAGEWEELAAEHRRLQHGSSLLAGAQSALEALSEAEGAILPQLAAVTARLRALGEHDARLAPILELLSSADAQAGEAMRALRQYASRVELDPRALRDIESRIEALHGAGRRFRVRPEALPELGEATRARLADLALAASPEALKQETAAAAERYAAAARKLTAKRKATAKALAEAVTQAMQQLAMKGGRFGVTLQPLEAPGAAGMESIEFEVSSHPSLPMRPLAKVASGGELSRLSLAIQLVAARVSPVGTLVFDEVDAGIGGAVAETVGRSLRQLGKARQVLCVTHLPQVAAQGDAQWSVLRSGTRGKVATSVARLDRAARVEELARMLGGAEITATTRKHAAELLDAG